MFDIVDQIDVDYALDPGAVEALVEDSQALSRRDGAVRVACKVLALDQPRDFARTNLEQFIRRAATDQGHRRAFERALGKR